MKHWHTVLMVLALTGLLFSPVLAAASNANPSDPPKARNTRKPATRPAATKTVRGELTSLNVETGVLTVKTLRKQQSDDVTLTTNDKTEVVLENVGVTLADLKLGMTVRATLDSNGIVTKVDAQPLTKKQKNRSNATSRPPTTTR